VNGVKRDGIDLILDTFLEFTWRALGKTCQDIGCPGRYSKAGRPEYDSGVLATDDYGLLGGLTSCSLVDRDQDSEGNYCAPFRSWRQHCPQNFW